MKYLVTGASGMLGSNLCLAALDAGHEVIASSHKVPFRHAEIAWRTADLTIESQARRLLREVQPDWIINCAGATDVDRCELEPTWAHALNVQLPANLADQVIGRLIHISSDAVFDGSSGANTESDPAAPINRYASSKLEGETSVLSRSPRAVVVRTNFYGWSPPHRVSLAEWFLDGLRNGQERPGFTDVAFSPMLVNHLAGILLRITEAELTGIYHVGSRDSMSKYEFGVQIAEAFGLDPDLVQQSKSQTSGLVAARPQNLTLSSQKAESDLGMVFPTILDGINELIALEQSGYPARLRKSFESELERVEGKTGEVP